MATLHHGEVVDPTDSDAIAAGKCRVEGYVRSGRPDRGYLPARELCLLVSLPSSPTACSSPAAASASAALLRILTHPGTWDEMSTNGVKNIMVG